MSELIHEFSAPIVDARGVRHTARIRGDADDNGHWQGWLEFVPFDGGPALRTGRETTQSRREHLEYWATGLSDTYLEQALRRAERAEDAPPVPPALSAPTFDPSRIRDPEVASSVVRVTLVTLDSTLPRRLMGMKQLPVGVARRVQGGGIIVYDGMEADDGEPSRHHFLVQYGSDNTGAVVLGNRLWSALRDEAATLLVEGREVPVRSHEIIEALRRR